MKTNDRKQKIFSLLLFALFFFNFKVGIALAVPPPDFIFSVGAQIIQIFSLGVLFFSAIFISSYKFLKIYYDKIKHKKMVGIMTLIFIITMMIGGAYLYNQNQQKEAYKNWLKESQNQNQISPSDKIITQEKNEKNRVVSTSENESFFNKNQATALSISNKEFQEIINLKKKYSF